MLHENSATIKHLQSKETDNPQIPFTADCGMNVSVRYSILNTRF